MITRNFKLFLTAGRSIPLLINANQYDHGETWIFTLYDETGQKYTPSSGGIVGIKSDGYVIADTGTVNSAGQVVIIESEQMTAAAGKAIYELEIDGQTHGTANFCLMVEPKPGDGGIVSDSDLSLIQQALDSTNPEAIAQGVSDWMDENLTPTTPVVDASLTVQGAAADAKKTGDEISDLKSQIAQIGSGIPVEVKRAMDALFQNMALNDYDGSSEFATIHAWATAIHVVSLSAVFTQGDNMIFSCDSLDSLKQYLTVTATYDDQSTSIVTTYTLSGTLTGGQSTITVNYGGKSTSFNVDVTEGTDVTPALSSYTYEANTQLTLLENGINVKTRSNGTYRYARVNISVRKGYTYRVYLDETYVKGDVYVGFRDRGQGGATGAALSPAIIPSGGEGNKSQSVITDILLSDAPNWSDETSPSNTSIFYFVTFSTSKAGEASFTNIKVIEYLAEAEEE